MSGNTFTPGPSPNTVKAADGSVLNVPAGWVPLPPGDAALTRRVKSAGDHWVVQETKGRKLFSRGVWAPAATIERIQAELEAERSTESFAKRQEADAKRREKAQEVYVEDFTGAVVSFLAFLPNHADLAQRLAKVVADHATPYAPSLAELQETNVVKQLEGFGLSAFVARQVLASTRHISVRTRTNLVRLDILAANRPTNARTAPAALLRLFVGLPHTLPTSSQCCTTAASNRDHARTICRTTVEPWSTATRSCDFQRLNSNSTCQRAR